MGGVGRTYVPLCLVAALALGACGGERQDANEPDASFPVEVVDASFPSSQQVSRTVPLEIEVRNAGEETIPDIALTVQLEGSTGAPAFGESVPRDGSGGQLASPSRPVWILDEGPLGGDTAYVNTWTLGKLEPDSARTFSFRVTPVRPGRYTLTYRVAAGLTGKARATGPGGGPAEGRFTVQVSDAPGTSLSGS